MSIVFHQTTQRTGGSDIVRTRIFDSGTVTIGRGSDCDIQLTDLATSLRHAAIYQTGPGEIRIEALGPQAFEINGRLVHQVVVNTQTPSRIGFGTQVITVSAAEDPADVSLAQVIGQSSQGAESQLDETTLFSPGAGIFGKRAMAWALAVSVLLACLIVPIVALTLHAHSPAAVNKPVQFDRQWSTGPLSQAHAFLDKDCNSCHQKAFVSVQDETCLGCHKLNQDKAGLAALLQQSKDLGSPFAPNLIKQHAVHNRWLAATPPRHWLGASLSDKMNRALNRAPDGCASCHREHVSGDTGTDKPADKSSHRRAVPALVQTISCADCHANLKTRLADTPLVDTPSWEKHPQFRPIIATQDGGKLELKRVALSADMRDNSGLIFSHQLHMMPLGGVTRMAQVLGREKGYGAALTCKSCHEATGAAQDMRPIDMQRDCGACHALNYTAPNGSIRSLPHGDPAKAVALLNGRPDRPGNAFSRLGAWLRHRPGAEDKSSWAALTPPIEVPGPGSTGTRLAFGKGGLCVDCHRSNQGIGLEPIHVSNRTLIWGAFNHDVKAHSQNPNGQANCASCHKAALSDNASDVMTPSIKVCANCHGKTKAQEPQAAPANCETCHGFHTTGTLRQPPVPIRFSDHPSAPKA